MSTEIKITETNPNNSELYTIGERLVDDLRLAMRLQIEEVCKDCLPAHAFSCIEDRVEKAAMAAAGNPSHMKDLLAGVLITSLESDMEDLETVACND